jgi:large subunit ribosomal protein L21
MDYAIIKLGNKQHRVRDGETLVVDRVHAEEGKSFEPIVLLGDKVTATVVAHGRGPKIVIGKYRRRTGYKRHNGFRAATSQIEITVGAGGARKAAAAKSKAAKPKTESVPVAEAPTPEPATPKAPGPPHATIEAPLAKAPEGYEGMTIAQVTEAAKGWSIAEVEAALTHEVETTARKGAIHALEAALKKKEEPEDGA